jgi:DNA mismatch repair protein MutS
MIDQDLDFSTPMMQQYMQLKEQYQDCVLWFRLGDFYEMFLEDAKIGAEVLDITLTSRSRGKDGRIPMAGVPYHAADNYLSKLIKAGYKVAICEQMTQPDGKNLVEREVIRIITPGTVLDEKTLEKKENNFLMALEPSKNVLGVALADLSTGEFHASQIQLSQFKNLEQVLSDVITQYNPSECILSPEIFHKNELPKLLAKYKKLTVFPVTEWSQWVQLTKKRDHRFADLDIYKEISLLDSIAKTAATVLLGYLHQTQKTTISHFRKLQPIFSTQYLHMDRSTITNLELLTTLHDGQRRGSFLDTIDYTRTAMGGRLIKHWLLHPLVDKKKIEERLGSVATLLKKPQLREQLSEIFSEIPDIERLLARLSLNQGNPKDLKALELALAKIHQLQLVIRQSKNELLEKITLQISVQVFDIQKTIHASVIDMPPFDPRQGGIFHDGQHTKLDELRKVVNTSREWIAQLEAEERTKTGIGSLKIKFNQVFGFYIEISKSNLKLVPDTYMRKQTLVNAERFITPELKKHEEIILTAEEEMNEIEYQLFLQLVAQVLEQLSALQTAAHTVAQVDCLLSFAQLAEEQNYVKPELVEDGELEIIEGRHPVVEQLLAERPFIPNDTVLNHQSQQLLLITGPNMAGKSVFMRQIALISLLAHLGSFVPAKRAKISLLDQIFVRSGASDMISAGLSTFMVEMVETAYILQHATEKSLIIMDEIGRGTSTYDGISIAWAIAEYLAKNCERGAKTLFATHYHELQALAEECPDKIQNYHMAITEHEGKPVFLYKLTPGGASHSFGVAVAQLAGLPKAVVDRAYALLHELEARNLPIEVNGERKIAAAIPPSSEFIFSDSFANKIKNLSIEQLTPLEALNLLAEWKNEVK